MKNTVTKIILLFTTLLLASACCNDDAPVTAKQGKVNIYIEGNITNEEAAAQLEAELGTLTENIYVQETIGLTDITINLVGNIRDIYFDKNLDLKNVTINGNNSKANNITISEASTNPFIDPTDEKYENITVNGIIEVRNLTIRPEQQNAGIFNCNDLISINDYLYFGFKGSVFFNKLKYINRLKKENGIYSTMGSTSSTNQTFNMPELEEVYNIELWHAIETLTFPKLKKAKGLLCEYQVNFQTLNLPLLENCEEIYMRRLNNIGPSNQTFNFPNLTYCKRIILLDLQLDTNKVNAILHHFLNVNPVSGKLINLDWDNAAPSGQGLIDKQTLIDQGNNVITN